MAATAKICPDCATKLEPIKIVDATNPLLPAGGTHHVELNYAAESAERSWMSQSFPIAGALRGWMCPTCLRVLIYAEPKSDAGGWDDHNDTSAEDEGPGLA